MPLDSIAVLSPLDRATDANGDPVPGAVLYFYEAGTSTPKTVYSDAALEDALGTSVTCDAGGFPTSDGSTRVMIYTGTAAYKLVVKDADGVTLWTLDDIPGAPVIPDVASAALPETPVISRTSSYQIVPGDKGKLIEADPTGGSFAITLPSAITAGDSFRIGVRHNGAATSNIVSVRSTGGQVIGAPGQSAATAISLTGLGQSFWFVSNGATWSIDTSVPPLMAPGGVVYCKIVDRLTAPPTSPVGGQRYIINGSPSGVWATLSFAEHDIAESDGNGSWLKYTPQNGWMAWVDDEDLVSIYHDSAWADQGGMATPSSSSLKRAIYEHQVTQNTGGGTNTSGSLATRPLTAEVVDTIGMSLATNEVTVPVGVYLVIAEQQLYHEAATTGSVGVAQQKLTAGTATFDAIPLGMPTRNGGVVSGAGVTFTSYHTHALKDIWLLNVTVAGTLTLQYKTNFATTTTGLGYPANNGTEVYARLTFIDLASLQGPPGEQGPQGDDGLDAAYAFQWSTSTSGDPGTGKIAVNNASLASATQLRISETDAYGANLSAVFATWDDSTSSIKARVKISKEGATQNFVEALITGAGTDQGAYWTFPITYVAAGGTISASNSVAVIVVEKGDKGDSGSTGPTGSTSFTFDSTTTDSDPGSGKLRLNNATAASATVAYIDNNNRGGSDVSAWLDTFDDFGVSAGRGQLCIFDAAAPTTVFRIFNITGSVVDGTGYRKVTIAHVTGAGSFVHGNEILAAFFARGVSGAGDITGPGSSTDNALARFDLATGKVIQDSGVILDDSNNVSGVAGLSATTIELGHASDTTMSRAEAGVVAVEGVPLYSQVPQNAQSAAYTAVLADAQKHILHPSSDNNARTFTIPANASVAYPIGTCLTFVNLINTVTIAITSDTLILAGPGTTGSRSLGANGIATALKVGATTWVISGAGLT